ncbi:MAG: phosphoribosylaminoimidazolesuccinocarboxamide synthase [Nitrospinae bacterium]|nr:phosphoribosylaminoimidazolesuccinocarboxamide synthase [Nitrospinota bacterium]
MEKREKIYEGKAKVLYATEDPNFLIQYFKDDATAFNAQKRGTIREKGLLNNQISSTLFQFLEGAGIETHFVRTLGEREMLVKRLEILPIEVVVRNIVAGSLSQRLGLPEGTPLAGTILEFYYKRDDLGDPMINEYHIRALGLATEEEMARVSAMALRINVLLQPFLEKRGLRLIDAKYEFGRYEGRILLGDEISPDGCRFWDMETDEKMDKDRFRRDLGRVEEVYQEVWRRVCAA